MPRLLFIALFLASSIHAGASAFAEETQSIPIRVCVVDGADSVKLFAKGGYRVSPIHSDEALKEGKALAAKVSATKGGILMAGREFNTAGFTVRASRGGSIFVNDRQFGGSIDIIRRDDLKIIVVNHLGVEEYLYGVLYHEVSPRWPMESLKAQAIAARTFALYQRTRNEKKDYDLRSDIYSQVYGGKSSERWITNKAVDLTRGLVLTYNGGLFPAYYHATCAGRTEDASTLWAVDIPPLKGGPCAYCKDSPHYEWKKALPLADMTRGLVAAGYGMDDISSIRVLSRNSSGRVEKLEIKDSTGALTIITAKELRQVLGPNILRSTNFTVETEASNAVFAGSGWGHGVGMCQWGARGMARAGKPVEEIMQHYYPGAEITPIARVKDKL